MYLPTSCHTFQHCSNKYQIIEKPQSGTCCLVSTNICSNFYWVFYLQKALGLTAPLYLFFFYCCSIHPFYRTCYCLHVPVHISEHLYYAVPNGEAHYGRIAAWLETLTKCWSEHDQGFLMQFPTLFLPVFFLTATASYKLASRLTDYTAVFNHLLVLPHVFFVLQFCRTSSTCIP